MSASTIEWTDETWNPVTGCDRVSPGCDNCYAERIANRFAGSKGFPDGFAVTLHRDRLAAPLRWRKPRRVFVNSMSDLFHPEIPDEFILDVWATMSAATQHTFQILTKRAQRMERVVGRMDWPPLPNVWLGVSVENQQYADLRMPHLAQTPARVRFVSAEPLLGPVDLTRWIHRKRIHEAGGSWTSELVDWVVVGGESGPGARPMAAEWARSLRDQCADEPSVSFFFKQWGGVHKKTTGRVLDGRTWDEYPR